MQALGDTNICRRTPHRPIKHSFDFDSINLTMPHISVSPQYALSMQSKHYGWDLENMDDSSLSLVWLGLGRQPDEKRRWSKRRSTFPACFADMILAKLDLGIFRTERIRARGKGKSRQLYSSSRVRLDARLPVAQHRTEMVLPA